MRILHVAKRYPCAHGGDGVVVINLRHHQEAAGHEVQVLTSNCPEIVSDPMVRKFGIPISSESIDTINLRRILTLAWLAVYAFWYLHKVKPDVIHAHTMDFGFAMSFAARAYGIPSVHTSHGTCFDNDAFPKAKGLLEVFLIKHAGHRRLLTVDVNSVAAFADHGMPDVVYTPNAVEPDRFTPQHRVAGVPFRLICVARVELVKGLTYLLDAVSRLLRAGIQVELQLVGEGALLADLCRQVQRLNIVDAVHFLGRRSGQDVAQLFAQADLFVLPSLHEGFPLVLLEAWASGLPCIVTGVGGIPGICVDGEDSLIVEPADPAALEKAIRRAVEDDELRARLGANGRRRVEQEFDYASASHRLEAIYAEVLT